MVILAAVTVLVLGQATPSPAEPDRVRQALKANQFPWYDPASDSARPIWPDDPEPPSGDFGPGMSVIGQVLMMLSFLALVLFLVGGLVWAYQHYVPTGAGTNRPARKPSGTASRTSSLPSGLPSDLADPWAEALRLRASGDLAGAIVAMFVYQLRTLDAAGAIRLAPGKTARQLVRSVSATDARSALDPTLRLFEEAYYGHRPPSHEDFAAAWRLAEIFRERSVAGRAT